MLTRSQSPPPPSPPPPSDPVPQPPPPLNQLPPPLNQLEPSDVVDNGLEALDTVEHVAALSIALSPSPPVRPSPSPSVWLSPRPCSDGSSGNEAVNMSCSSCAGVKP